MAQTENNTMIKYPHFIWPWQEYVTRTSLTFVEGDQHKKFRKILSKSFHFEFLKSNVSTVVGIIHEAFDDMEKKGLQNVEILEVIGSITGEVIGRTFFGFDHRTAMFRGRKLTDAVFDVEIMCAKLSQTITYQVLGPKFVKLGILRSHRELVSLCREFREYCMKYVVKRKKELIEDRSRANSKYLVDNLILAQFEDENESLKDEEILDQYVVFFLAGQKTTSNLVTMCLYCLAKQPEIVRLIRKEIKEKVVDIDKVEYEELNALNYLNAAIKEAFRLYTPLQILFFREAVKTFKIENINVVKGTLLNVYLGFAAFNEKYFKDPEKFDPMRWIGDGEGTKMNDSFLTLPFWAGSRNCIGQHLSWMEIRNILAQFLMRYEFKVPEDYRLRLTQTISYEPIEWFKMNLEKIK